MHVCNRLATRGWLRHEWARLFASLLCVLLGGVAAANAAQTDGVSPNTISLPSGPGSIEGLGESFEPQRNTGTASYGIAFALPPGRAGHAPALGLSYEGGEGVSTNREMAFEWYRQAATRGNGRAMNGLARLYAEGRGIRVDLVKAHAWNRVAGSNGFEGHQAFARLIESEMSAEDVLAAAQLAAELDAKYGGKSGADADEFLPEPKPGTAANSDQR